MKNNEQLHTTPEQQTNPAELEALGNERREALRDSLERSQELAPRDQAEAARTEALEKAVSAETKKHPAKSREHSPAERRRGVISRKERDASYKATMKEVQTHMSPTSRTFSKIIHTKIVEEVSDTLANTVARPNAILSGAIAAFLISLATLLIAKHYGYRLSGFEAIGAFVAGWLLGILYDFFKVMITGKK
jgi:hypothetical protein